MQPRQSLLALFSTFLSFGDDRIQGWLTDRVLQQHMQKHIAQNPETSEELWALYWHAHWQQFTDNRSQAPEGDRSKIPEGHLSAYLQETCYWSVQRVIPKKSIGQMQPSDYFQVAIAQVPKLLRKFDRQQRPSLKAYAHRAFGNIVRDYLRQRQEANCCSDWGLLMKVSRKRLLEALQQAGIYPAKCEQLLLLWTCFEDISLPKKVAKLRQIQAPDTATWQKIIDQYDDQRSSIQTPASALTIAQAERELLQAAKQVRHLLYPPSQSLNLPKGEDTLEEIQDDLPTSEQESLLTELIQQEDWQKRQQQQQQIQAFLTHAIADLSQHSQNLLRLYYGQRLKQQQISQQLGIQQSTVSRHLSKTREDLLLQLVTWAQSTWHILPDSTVVDSISTVLEEWLQHHYEPASADAQSP
jgi:RNA polymerase sigma factor (sigma-70 family)